jgi:pimeloyl-ACP methyl ester carboxylesterase
MRRACIALTLVLAAALCAAPTAQARTGPKGAAFYTPPSKPSGTHGGLIWSRRQTGSDALEGASRNTLLLYRSVAHDGRTTAVSGSVALPKGKAPRGGWPVIVYGHGTTGSADSCAPTRGYDANHLVSYAYPLLRRWLKAGYAIVRSDFIGLGTPGAHPFLYGPSEGRSLLDAVRAARKQSGKLSKRFVIAGHSQGGHAALYAASLAPSWTPDLKLRGTVALAPASHLTEQGQVAANLTNPGGGISAFLGLVVRGVDETAPSVDVPALLSDKGNELYPQTLDRCYDALREADSFGGQSPAALLRQGADRAPFFAALSRSSDPESLKIRTPLRVDQGADDTTVFKVFTDQLVDEYRKAGGKVTYKTYPGTDHAGVMAKAAKAATGWIRARLKP